MTLASCSDPDSVTLLACAQRLNDMIFWKMTDSESLLVRFSASLTQLGTLSRLILLSRMASDQLEIEFCQPRIVGTPRRLMASPIAGRATPSAPTAMGRSGGGGRFLA